MAATKYTKSISAAFPNHIVDADRLTLEIKISEIVTSFHHIDTSGDVCDIWFKDALSVVDVDLLNGLVAVHSGVPLAASGPTMRLPPTDPLSFRRFGSLTAASASEALVYGRAYAEPADQAQRSLVSTSANDKGALGGSSKVRITYLNNSYELKTETVLLNGTTPVPTGASNIRFIEQMEIVKGSAAAGIIKLMTGADGTGTEIAAIAAGGYKTDFAHHYVPAGMKCYVSGWGASVTDDAELVLYGQLCFSDNLVNRVIDRENLLGIANPPGRLDFQRKLSGVSFEQKTYIRATAIPGQATSTVIRCWLDLYEETL